MAEDLALFAAIAADRYAAARLWTPELSLDLIDRDLALWTAPFDVTVEQVLWSSGTTDFCYAMFPAAWPSDEGVSNLRMRLSMYLEGGIQVALDTAIFGFESGDQQQTFTSTSYSWALFSRTWSPPFPTGETLIRLSADGASDPAKARRQSERGPDCFLQFLYTS